MDGGAICQADFSVSTDTSKSGFGEVVFDTHSRSVIKYRTRDIRTSATEEILRPTFTDAVFAGIKPGTYRLGERIVCGTEQGEPIYLTLDKKPRPPSSYPPLPAPKAE